MSAAPKGYSLHVGLNAVDPTRHRGWRGSLTGCENDARDMQALASRLNYKTTCLLTEDAKFHAVKDNIEATARELVEGDIFLFTCSSHGCKLPDETDDEKDGLDEALCLFDDYYIDDELELLWHRFAPGVRILVVVDACFSGTILMSAFLGDSENLALLKSALGSAAGARPSLDKVQPPSVTRRVYLDKRAEFMRRQIEARAQRLRLGPLNCTVRLLSACAENERAQDGPENSVFTDALLETWAMGRFDGDYDLFLGAIRNSLGTRFTPQHKFIGPVDRDYEAQKPFSIEHTPARMRSVRSSPVGARTDGLAASAIARHLVESRADELRDWRVRVPGTDWKLDESTWISEAQSVIDILHRYDPDVRIDPGEPAVGHAILQLRDRPLAEFHQYLVDVSEMLRPAADR